MPCPSVGPNCFRLVQIFLTNSYNDLDLTKMIWACPKQLEHDQNDLDGPKLFIEGHGISLT